MEYTFDVNYDDNEDVIRIDEDYVTDPVKLENVTLSTKGKSVASFLQNKGIKASSSCAKNVLLINGLFKFDKEGSVIDFVEGGESKCKQIIDEYVRRNNEKVKPIIKKEQENKKDVSSQKVSLVDKPIEKNQVSKDLKSKMGQQSKHDAENCESCLRGKGHVRGLDISNLKRENMFKAKDGFWYFNTERESVLSKFKSKEKNKKDKKHEPKENKSFNKVMESKKVNEEEKKIDKKIDKHVSKRRWEDQEEEKDKPLFSLSEEISNKKIDLGYDKRLFEMTTKIIELQSVLVKNSMVFEKIEPLLKYFNEPLENGSELLFKKMLTLQSLSYGEYYAEKEDLITQRIKRYLTSKGIKSDLSDDNVEGSRIKGPDLCGQLRSFGSIRVPRHLTSYRLQVRVGNSLKYTGKDMYYLTALECTRFYHVKSESFAIIEIFGDMEFINVLTLPEMGDSFKTKSFTKVDEKIISIDKEMIFRYNHHDHRVVILSSQNFFIDAKEGFGGSNYYNQEGICKECESAVIEYDIDGDLGYKLLFCDVSGELPIDITNMMNNGIFKDNKDVIFGKSRDALVSSVSFSAIDYRRINIRLSDDAV